MVCPKQPTTGVGPGWVFTVSLSKSVTEMTQSVIPFLPGAVPLNPCQMETLRIPEEEVCEFGLAQWLLWNLFCQAVTD